MSAATSPLQGGKASAAKLTPAERQEKARKAAMARWAYAESVKIVNRLIDALTPCFEDKL